MSGEDLKGILTVATALVPLVLGIALLADKYGLADSIAKLDVKAILGQVGRCARGMIRAMLRHSWLLLAHNRFSYWFEQVESRVSDLGPWGYVLFAAVYVAAEVLAVPAMPLTGNLSRRRQLCGCWRASNTRTQGRVMLSFMSSVPHSGKLNKQPLVPPYLQRPPDTCLGW